ncbi:MAG TPA: hypothetical protein PKY29_00310 [Ferruginibacter sp.]|nr:hypothetical protein [Ferruginibacter sp.]HRO16659.1 hypothetical protein [Ferruginibacter sp.]HRQ19719.1 hypothetical protein [Ferruginibacter sp.]
MNRIIITLSLTLLTYISWANNITVTNTSLNGQNTTSDFTLVNFDVAWENSWRTNTNESNYDGAWIFVKYRKNGTSDWRHCTISSTGNTAASGAVFSIPSDNKGAFIYRISEGIGNVNFTGNQLQWNYGADGVLDNETVEIRVFAVEMVYIPQGSFQLGSGGTETYSFRNGTDQVPYTVASNGAINLGTTSGTLNPNGAGVASGTIPEAFPKGYNAFWVMKYEISQQQYADFLNHISSERATYNVAHPFDINGTHPNLMAQQPERAIGNLNTARLAAHADWSGLRPMTELEFEKICRGYNTPAVPNEYVWGNTQIFPVISTDDVGLATESVNAPASANANINNQLARPARTGMFARSNGSTRTLSGGTYYGVMNMGDNINEICIGIHTTAGRAFTGAIHGDGYLAASGETNIPEWKNFNAYGWRGGAFNTAVTDARISERQSIIIYASIYFSDVIVAAAGGRLARTAQ